MNEITITLTGQEAQKWLQYKANQINAREKEDADKKRTCFFCIRFGRGSCIKKSTTSSRPACGDFVQNGLR